MRLRTPRTPVYNPDRPKKPRVGGRVAGKIYERERLLRGRRSETLPEDLVRFQRAGLLDTEFERGPLPDSERPCDLDYIWASDINVDCGKRTRPYPTLDHLAGTRDDNYVRTKEDKA